MKDFFISVLKMMIVILIIFIIPFLLPLILKLFLKINVFVDVSEFKDIANIFNNMYIFIYILLGIGILLWFFHEWSTIKEIIKNMNFSFTFGNNKISAEHVREEMDNINQQKEFINKISKEVNNDSENTINEAKLLLGIDKRNNTKKECKECNKGELEEEISKLRDFATYNMINTEAKSLLHIIYNEKYIDTDKFKSNKLNKLLHEIVELNKDITDDSSLGEGFAIGHSYFCNLEKVDDITLNRIVEFELIPLLKEYWFDERSRVNTWSEKLRGAIK